MPRLPPVTTSTLGLTVMGELVRKAISILVHEGAVNSVHDRRRHVLCDAWLHRPEQDRIVGSLGCWPFGVAHESNDRDAALFCRDDGVDDVGALARDREGAQDVPRSC